MSKYVLLGVLEEEEARLCVLCRVLGFLALGSSASGVDGFKVFRVQVSAFGGLDSAFVLYCGTGT